VQHSDILLQQYETLATLHLEHLKTLDTYVYNIHFQCNMGGQRSELGLWRQPCEMAAAGGVRDDQGESARAEASNGMGGWGARSGLCKSKRHGQGAGSEHRAVRPSGQTRFIALPLKKAHDEILGQC
jgi:hypothetical protein